MRIVLNRKNNNIEFTQDNYIEKIIDVCDETLNNNWELIVNDFGDNKDLLLSIEKDSEYDLVDIVTINNKTGEPLDDAIGISISDGSLYEELIRIWNHEDFELLD